jgi:precorrin-3B methylase
MFLKDIRQYVTEQLDTTVQVLRKHRDNSGFIVIKEKAGKDDEDRKEEKGKLLLNEIKIINIPQTGVWIFEKAKEKCCF